MVAGRLHAFLSAVEGRAPALVAGVVLLLTCTLVHGLRKLPTFGEGANVMLGLLG